MKSLSALDIHYLLKEIDFLINAKVDKIYHPSKKELIIQFFVSSKGKFQLKINDNSLYLTEHKSPSDSPTDFCLFLRKKLSNSRLRKISQFGFERIVVFEFSTKEDTFELVFEIFSKGNIILLKDNKILVASEYQKWASRIVRPRAEYIYPKRDYNFFTMKKQDYIDFLNITKKDSLVATLASDLGLGGVFAEEACVGLTKSSNPKELSVSDKNKLFTNLDFLKNQKISPHVLMENDLIIQIVPFKFSSIKDLKPVVSLSNAFDQFFEHIHEVESSLKSRQQLDKINNIIQKQEEQIKILEGQEKENHQKAELLYQNYKSISDILSELKTISKSHDWDEIKKKLKGHKIIKDVLPKDKSIIVEI